MPPSPLLLSRLKLPRLDLVPESTLCVPDTGSSANINSQQNLSPRFLLLVATHQKSSQILPLYPYLSLFWYKHTKKDMNGINGGENVRDKKKKKEWKNSWKYTQLCIAYLSSSGFKFWNNGIDQITFLSNVLPSNLTLTNMYPHSYPDQYRCIGWFF